MTSSELFKKCYISYSKNNSRVKSSGNFLQDQGTFKNGGNCLTDSQELM